MLDFEDSKKLAPHATSLLKNVHKCKVCPYLTTSVFLMVNHMKRHRSSITPFNCETSNIETYYCSNCDFQTELTLHFKQHIEESHRVKRQKQQLSNVEYIFKNYMCPKCKFETHFLMKWRQHTMECMGRKKKRVKRITKILLKRFECDQCDFKSKYKRSLNNHKISKHLKDDEILWYKCEECSFRSKQQEHLKKHIMMQHLDDKDVKWFKCQECPYKTKRQHLVKQHIIIHHSNGQDIKCYECPQCPYKTYLKSYLTNQMRTQKSDKWYQLNLIQI